MHSLILFALEKMKMSDLVEDIHIWQQCSNCDLRPIIGARYECQTCPAGPDMDLCESCYNEFTLGKISFPKHKNAYSSFPESTKPHTFKKFMGKSYEAKRLQLWQSLSTDSLPNPPLPKGFVIRPIFNCGQHFLMGSAGFVIKYNEKILFVTAIHILDSIVKSLNYVPSSNQSLSAFIADKINTVDLFDIFADNWMMNKVGTAAHMYDIEEAKTGDEEPFCNEDIAVFNITERGSLSPQTLAKEPPKLGDRVWQAFPSSDNKLHIHSATIVEINEDSLIFRYDHKGQIMEGGSGSPLLNKNGEVLGILVGGGHYDGMEYGYCNQLNSIQNHLMNIEQFF